jgi:hypothetical protein
MATLAHAGDNVSTQGNHTEYSRERATQLASAASAADPQELLRAVASVAGAEPDPIWAEQFLWSFSTHRDSNIRVAVLAGFVQLANRFGRIHGVQPVTDCVRAAMADSDVGVSAQAHASATQLRPFLGDAVALASANTTRGCHPVLAAIVCGVLGFVLTAVALWAVSRDYAAAEAAAMGRAAVQWSKLSAVVFAAIGFFGAWVWRSRRSMGG